jgi:hypothetical protein
VQVHCLVIVNCSLTGTCQEPFKQAEERTGNVPRFFWNKRQGNSTSFLACLAQSFPKYDVHIDAEGFRGPAARGQ